MKTTPTQKMVMELQRRRSADKLLTFAEIQAGPNPITLEELEALIEKRPEVYGVFRAWLAERRRASPKGT